MKRILSLAVALLLVAGTAFGWPLARVWKGGAPYGDNTWWRADGSLTFWAPFDDSASPLKLNVGTGSLSFTRATTATRVATDNGYITSTPSGTLRIESNGALIEGQRTNLALYSEQLGLAANWTATNVTVDNNTAVAPDGATTAETLTATGDNATLLQSYTGTVAAYTASYYLKRKTGTGAVQISADNTTWTSCTINASTWTRCTDTRTVTVATYYHGIRLATNTDAVYAYGGMNELGAFASSLVNTTTGAVTRNADVLSFTGSGNVAAAAGTVVFSGVNVGGFTGGTTNHDAWTFGPVTNNRLMFRIDPTGDPVFVYGTGTTTANIDIGQVTIGTPYKAAAAWNTTDGYAAKDGGTVGTNPADPGPTIAETCYIGSTSGTAGNFFGNIKNLRIWNRVFSSTELQLITQ